MNSRLLPIVRRHLPEFRHGRWKAGRLHVGSSPREIVRECFRVLTPKARTRLFRTRRAALYLGAMAGIRSHRRLCRRFRL